MKVTQPCPTLCDPMGYTSHGILQAKILEWVALPFKRSSESRDWTQVSWIAGGISAQQFRLTKFTSRNLLNGNILTSTKRWYMLDPLSIVIITWKQPEWSTVVDYSHTHTHTHTHTLSKTMQENIYYTVIKYSELWLEVINRCS